MNSQIHFGFSKWLSISFGQNIDVVSPGLKIRSEASLLWQQENLKISDTRHSHFCCHFFYCVIPYYFEREPILALARLILNVRHQNSSYF